MWRTFIVSYLGRWLVPSDTWAQNWGRAERSNCHLQAVGALKLKHFGCQSWFVATSIGSQLAKTSIGFNSVYYCQLRAIARSVTAETTVVTQNLPQSEECSLDCPRLVLPLSFSKPGCLACKQLPTLVWHLLCQHTATHTKLIKRLALPLPHLPFPPEQTPQRGSHSRHLCYLENKRARMSFSVLFPCCSVSD